MYIGNRNLIMASLIDSKAQLWRDIPKNFRKNADNSMNKSLQLWQRLGIISVQHLILHRPKVSQIVIAQPKQSCVCITAFSEIRYREIQKNLGSQ